MSELVIDGCAGAGGWDLGARLAGYTGRIVGIEKDAAACATGQAAGHQRVRADVAAFPLGQLAGKVAGLMFSPPCPTFSAAGDGAGRVDAANVLRLIADFSAGRPPGQYEWVDDRSALTAQPMRYAVALRPRWVALEQVPPVLPIWRYMAELLRGLGYRVWSGVLGAEEYGVPQTRRRAILIASLDGPVGPPAPTHQPYRAGRDIQVGPDLFGDQLPPPVSMAQALGWSPGELVGFPRRADTPTNKVGGDDQVITLDGVDYRARDLRPAPAPALTEKARSWSRWLAPAGVTSAMVDPRPDTDPAHTTTGKATAAWVLRNGTQDNACARSLDEPAGTLFFGQRANAVDWVTERPSTTVCGDPRIGRPGHKDRDQGEAQFADGSVRVTVTEAAILQGFPPDYPWQGTKTQQYRQVGDANPPPLAAAILRPLLADTMGAAA